MRDDSSRVASQLRPHVHPLEGPDGDWSPLLDLVGDARIVLLGEASHGTHEFYEARARITRRLIASHGFAAVAVEADWPDADRVNQYVRHRGRDASSQQALDGFRRFPQWMWRNTAVVALVDWLRDWNTAQTPARHAGFYGIDLYSLFTSIEVVLAYLDRVDPAAAQRARQRYACFEHFQEDPQSYGYTASFDLSRACEDDVVAQLRELRQRAALDGRPDPEDGDALFSAQQNARLVLNAEEYYRSMFRGRVSSWNLRDQHMADTVEELLAHLDRDGREAKLVVWAHNSHLGDARATEMGRRGELNVGQLLRQRFGDACVNVGFTTHTGTVTAATDWDEPAQLKRVNPSLRGSYERVLHEVDVPRFLLDLRADVPRELLLPPRLERAIGVIYRPETERLSHYFEAVLPDQFDAVIHFDETRAVEPLERAPTWELAEAPETYPSGI